MAMYFPDKETEGSQEDIALMPTQCIDCLHRKVGQCMAMKDFQEEDCFARVTDHAEHLQRLYAMRAYEQKNSTQVDPKLIQEIHRAAERKAKAEAPASSRLEHGDIMACLAADMHRGKGGGGGEKEKAPNKRRLKRRTVDKWEGFYHE